jgi:hypothetical protein
MFPSREMSTSFMQGEVEIPVAGGVDTEIIAAMSDEEVGAEDDAGLALVASASKDLETGNADQDLTAPEDENCFSCKLFRILLFACTIHSLQIGYVVVTVTFAGLVLNEVNNFDVKAQFQDDDKEKQDNRDRCTQLKDVATWISIFNLVLAPFHLYQYWSRSFTQTKVSDDGEWKKKRYPARKQVGVLNLGLAISLACMFSIAEGFHFWYIEHAAEDEGEVNVCGEDGKFFISICWWQAAFSAWILMMLFGAATFGFCFLCVPKFAKACVEDAEKAAEDAMEKENAERKNLQGKSESMTHLKQRSGDQ